MDSTGTACAYLSGLLQCEKGHENMERMTEKVEDSDYKRYVHFLSSSKWSAWDVNLATLGGADRLLREQKRRSGHPTGLIIDETSHLKKGDKSVGVARQYAGTIGNISNCQVSVHASLANEKHCTLVGSSLYLPKKWCENPARCQEAGIPVAERQYRSKPALALGLIRQAIENDVEFDFIAGDGLYGHDGDLTRALDGLGRFYVLDVHKNLQIFLREPIIAIPGQKKKGRPSTRKHPDHPSISVEDYINSLSDDDFTQERVRKTAKGWKVVKVHTSEVWQWNRQEDKACKRTLVVTIGDRTKFSVSNAEKELYTNKEWAYFQCSRYWVERCFDDCKNELGMSGYQVRGWMAWQHHMALVLVASLYILNIKIQTQNDIPLMSVRDARLLVIAVLFATQKEIDLCIKHMQTRHQQRKADIDRYFRKRLI